MTKRFSCAVALLIVGVSPFVLHLYFTLRGKVLRSEIASKLPLETRSQYHDRVDFISQKRANVAIKTVVPNVHNAESTLKISDSSIKNSLNGSTRSQASDAANDYGIHIVCSSDCSSYQRWQVINLLHSAADVAQEGRFTWLISGCDEHGEAYVRRTVAENSFVPSTTPMLIPLLHFTPDFSNMSVYGGPFAAAGSKRIFKNRKGSIVRSPYKNKYMFNNKPNALAHWARVAGPLSTEAIVFIDPDFLFLTPFKLPRSAPKVTQVGQRKSLQGRGLFGPGFPAAQSYGLGDQWLGFNLSLICGDGSQCAKTTSQEVYSYYSAGPLSRLSILFSFTWHGRTPLHYSCT